MKRKKGTISLTWGRSRCIAALLIFSISLQVSAASYGQQVTLSGNDLSLEQVFAAIRKQTGYNFMYLSEDLSQASRVDLHVKASSLKTVLDQCFAGQPLAYKIDGQVIIVKPRPAVKKKTNTVRALKIHGTVLDSATGQPLSGVTVQVKGTTRGTVTDGKGQFSLELLDDAARLVIRSLGYKTKEIVITGQTSLKITLAAAATGLDQVVVVGYGTQQKKDVTGSIAQITSEELVKAPMSSATNMLVGKLPGLIARQSSGQPGSDQSTLLIRGMGTYNNSSPLLLVDGVERNFNRIDPHDIESITILKDAAAAAIYGMRAAHGVILVKTKRGAKNSAPEITYSTSMTFNTNTRFPNFLNGVDYAKWHNKARELDGEEGLFSDKDIEKIANGDPDGVLGNTDWVDLLFKDYGTIAQHDLSVTGGSEHAQYYVSGGMMNQKGILPNTNFKRYNLRSNVDVDVTSDFALSFNLAGRKEYTDNPGFDIAPNNGYNPITQAIRALPVIPTQYDGLPTATGEGASTWSPLAAVNNSGFNKINRAIFESSASLAYKAPFLQGLTTKIFFSYDYNYQEQRNFLETYDVAKFNPVDKSYVTTKADGTGESSLFQASSYGSQMMIRPSLSYTGNFGKHNVDALLLYEFRQTDGSSFQAARRNFLLDVLPELTFAQEDVPNSIAGSSNQTKLAGYVGRVNYNFAQKYLAQFSFRYDGSYKFRKDYRWGFFPSLAVGWRISEENFFKAAFPVVDELKVRASVGALGRDNIDAFLYKRFFGLTAGPAYAFGIPAVPSYALYTTNSVPSTNLSWEKTRKANFGIDARLFDQALAVTFDAFYEYTYDILQGVAGVYPPSIAGNYPSISNSGAVDNRGFELAVQYRNHLGALSYNLGSNVSWAHNRVLKRTQAQNVPPWKNIIGQPIGTIYGFHALGLYQTEDQIANRPSGPGGVQRLGDLMYEDINGDGKIDYDDQKKIASSIIPEMIFSFSANLGWKGFDLSFQLQGAAIADVLTSGLYPSGIMDQTEFSRPFYSGGNAPYYLVENSWTPDHTRAKYPRLGVQWNGNNGWTSDWWVVNGTYLRLKQATVGYNLPERWLSSIHGKRLRIYLAGTNLLTVDALEYMDPEMPNNNNGYYPEQSSYSIGLDLTF